MKYAYFFLALALQSSCNPNSKKSKSDDSAISSDSLTYKETFIRESTANSKIESAEGREKLLVVQLYRLFNKVESSDSVTRVLLQNGKISIPREEMTSTTIIDFSDDKNAMRFENTESGNSSCIVKEYRVINADGRIKFIFSQFGGTRAFTNQHEFEVYDFNPSTKAFKPEAEAKRLFTVERKDYYLPSTPDSIIDNDGSHSDNFFHIVYVDSCVAENILVERLAFEEEKTKHWILGNTIRFKFRDGKFTRTEPFFK